MVLSLRQREARATRVGASEVAALMGEHPYMSELDVYNRIVNGETREPTINMEVGARLEPAVLRLARDLLGFEYRACTIPYIHPTLPLTASPDAYHGKHGLVEVKVTGAWSEALPRQVYWQAQTQLWLTRRDFAIVVALCGSSLRHTIVDVHTEDVWRIEEEVIRFQRDHLLPRVAPVTPPFTFKA